MLLLHLWHFHLTWESWRGREAEQHHKERGISNLQLQFQPNPSPGLEWDTFVSRLCLLRVN